MMRAGQVQTNILLLEDDRWFADSLARSLQASLPATAVEITPSPEMAMLSIDQHMPDLLIADLHLGGRNFLTLLNELSSYPDTLKLPKMILSSSGNDLSLDDLREYGVAAVYDKRTYDYTDLVNNVRRVLASVS